MEQEFNLKLTVTQLEAIVDFIECNTFESIRLDEGFDNFEYLTSLCEIWKKGKEILKENV